MKYIINKKNENMKMVSYKLNIDGLKIKPKNKSSILNLKIKELILVDKKLITSFINKRVNNKMNKIINFMTSILNEEETSDDDSALALNELNRLKGIINNKYKEFLTKTQYETLINKLIVIEDEFKKNYTQKQYLNYLSGNYYVEEVSHKSR